MTHQSRSEVAKQFADEIVSQATTVAKPAAGKHSVTTSWNLAVYRRWAP